MSQKLDFRELARTMLGARAYMPPRTRYQPDYVLTLPHDTAMVDADWIISCPTHDNPYFAALRGVIGRDKHGHVIVGSVCVTPSLA